MHDYLDLLIDKAGLPWFNANEKDKFLTLAQLSYVKSIYSAFEVTEKLTESISPLVRSGRITNNYDVIMLDVLPNFMYLLNIAGYFTSTQENVKDRYLRHKVNTTIQSARKKKGERLVTEPSAVTYHALKTNYPNEANVLSNTTLTNTKRKPITKVQLDDLYVCFEDPFETPDDNYPIYVIRADNSGHPYIQIYSTTVPTKVDLDFLTMPRPIDGENNPDDISDLQEMIHEEIVKICVGNMLENIESMRQQTFKQTI